MLVNFKRRKSRLRRRMEFLGALAALGAVVVFFDDIRAPIVRWHQTLRKKPDTTSPATTTASAPVNHNAALFALRATPQHFPLNLPAWEIAASALEAFGDSEALRLRHYVAVQQPAATEAALALAAAALRTGDSATAEITLAGIAPSSNFVAEHTQWLAAVALAQRRDADAEALLTRLASLEADPAVQQLRRQRAQLFAADSTVATAGKNALAQLAATTGPTQTAAVRELMLLAAATGAAEDATVQARALARIAPKDLSAQVFLANAQRRQGIDPREAEAAAGRLGTATPVNAVHFATWLLVQGRTAEARTWLEGLPAVLRDTAAVRAVFADCLAAQRQWDALSAQLAAGAWGPIPSDALTLAFSPLRLEERKRAELRTGIWQESIAASAKEANGLRILARLALYWDWQDEAAQALTLLGRRFREETWALPALVALATSRKDSSSLPDAYGAWREIAPDNRAVAARWAFAALINDPALGPTAAPSTLARELYAVTPADAVVAAGYALALHQQQKTKDAIAVLEKLPPSVRQFPQPALVLGVCLFSTGEASRAAPLLKSAERAPLSYFERKLLEETIARAESRVRRLPATKTEEFRPQRRPGQPTPMPARQEPAKAVAPTNP